MIFIFINKEETLLANFGGIDRIIRIFTGILIFPAAIIFVNPVAWKIALAVIGTIIFLNGLSRSCMAYVPFGLNTNKGHKTAK
jgi:hypothetical protein